MKLMYMIFGAGLLFLILWLTDQLDNLNSPFSKKDD